MSFATVNLEISTREQAIAAFIAKMQERFPSWLAADSDPLLWQAEWFADAYPDLANLLSDMSALAFRQFGEQVLEVPPISAIAASATTTWTLTDTAGHSIPAGTQVQIASGDDLYGFATVSDTIVANGVATATGVEIRALVTGEEANGLSADPTLIDALSFVSAITQTSDETSGGADAEDADAFLDRLVEEARLLSKVVIVPSQAATVVRRAAGVSRVTVIDNYDPDTDTYDNEKMLTVFPIDAEGEDVAAGVKTAIVDELTPRRESGFIFNVEDPTRTALKVTVAVGAYDGVDETGLAASIKEAIASYLSAATWGRSVFDTNPGIWLNQTIVRRFELVSLVDRVGGVDFVSTLTLAKVADALGTADITLDGPAPLPEIDLANITVTFV